MSDPVKNFEFFLNKQCKKKISALYCDTMNQNQIPFKPEDVISSVSKQLKAIQEADSSKYQRKSPNSLYKYRNSMLSVNKLSTVVHVEPPKQTTTFDTQCITDTQLVNIIEDAEIVDAHRGMTQEFETAFVHPNTEIQGDTDVGIDVIDKCTLEKIIDTDRLEAVLKSSNYIVPVSDDNKNINTITQEASHMGVYIDENATKESFNKSDGNKIVDNFCFEADHNLNENISNNNSKDEELSQVLETRIVSFKRNKRKIVKSDLKTDTIDKNSSEIKINSEFNLIRINTDENNKERTPSPIFSNKNVKRKSKSPLPLVFDLDQFEHFESMAISLLDSGNLNVRKHVVNSQILNKELHFNVNKEMEDAESNILSPHDKVKESCSVPSPDMDKKLLTINTTNPKKALCDLEDTKITNDSSSDNYKDEILFSSDEEENFTHRDYHDLPFTCALETSFYNQSDVLDKTMYVGFQTASNRSIQVCAGSFAKAKNLLSDVTNDDTTITDLVNSCDNCVKDKVAIDIKPAISTSLDQNSKLSQVGNLKIPKTLDLKENFDGKNPQENNMSCDKRNDKSKYCYDTKISDAQDIINSVTSVLEGFGEEIVQEFENIEMSLEDQNTYKKAVSESLDNLNDKIVKTSDVSLDEIEDVLKGIPFSEVLCETISEGDNNVEACVSQVLRNINTATISNNPIHISSKVCSKTNSPNRDTNSKEFYNIGSREINESIYNDCDIEQFSTIETRIVGFKTANNKDIQISDQALFKAANIFKDVDKVEITPDLPLSLENSQDSLEVMTINQSSSNQVFLGFKTANNENIKISDKAWSKTKAIFNNINCIELPKKNNKGYPDVSTKNHIITEKPDLNHQNSTKFPAGFITASNQRIEISDESFANINSIFNDIDFTKLEFTKQKSTPQGTNENNNGTKLDSSTCYKLASNKIFKVSERALPGTKHIFKDFDSQLNESFLNKIEDDNDVLETGGFEYKIVCPEISNDINFTGFKTASNKNIKISDDALTKTKDIFKDLYSREDKSLSKNKNIYPDLEHGSIEHDAFSPPMTPFKGFQTASVKPITVSKSALEKSKNFFKDLHELNSERTENSETYKNKGTVSKERVTFDEAFSKEEGTQRLIKPGSIELVKGLSEMSNEINFIGFKTASNKNIKISDDALTKTKDIFKDLDLREDKSISVNKNTYPRFEDYDTIEHGPFSSTMTSFKGFQTASAKPIAVSKLALEKSKNLFKDLQELNSEKTENSDSYKNIATVSKEKVTINEDFSKEKGLIKIGGSEFEKRFSEVSNVINFIGFKTANNKHIKISDDALAKTKDIFKDIESKNIEIPSTSKKEHPTVNIGFTGFHTASNKKVNISEKALAKTREIFRNFDNHNDFSLQNEVTKGQALYPQEILQENKINVEDYNALPVQDNINLVTSFKGFQTASAKPVAVSQSALEKSKKLFKDLENLENANYGGSDNSKMNVSEKSVTNASGQTVIAKSTNTLLEVETLQQTTVKDTNIWKQLYEPEDAEANAEDICRDLGIQNAKHKPQSKFNIGFQTGNNKAIAISKEALAKSKRLFSEIDNQDSINFANKDKKAHIHEDINSTLDTQVLNNFEKSLYTEDFIESPKSSKRSGSPILSCPRAKRKKKFEIPYSLKPIETPVDMPIEKHAENSNIIYRKDYKKDIKYTLKDLNDKAKNISIKNIDPYLYNFDYDNLLHFEFKHHRNDLSSNTLTVDLLKEKFLRSVNSKLIPNGWLDNHLKLILWKLISYEVTFNCLLLCTARNVLEQLKYRYDKELYNAHRPALRKIFEKDDVPSKTIVLCVVGIYVDDVMISSVPRNFSNIELLLTDGWYNIRCTIDKMLAQIVSSGKIKTGSKIVTSGAELTGCEQGVSPWEDTSLIRLKINGNSTRRARWDSRLGYINGTVPSQLSSIQVLGGKVSKLRILVTRVYPALYVEKFEDGSTVTRSERLENIQQMKAEAERQAFMEKLYEEVEKEFADQESQDSEGLPSSYKRTWTDSGSQIAKMMKLSKDPTEFRAQLTDSQVQLLEEHTSKNRERLLQDIQTRVRDRIEKAGVCVNRNVVSLLKIRLAGVTEKGDNVQITKGMMSIWKPNDAVQEVIKEGAWIDVMNVIPTAIRYSEIQISASRQSIFSASKYKEPDKLKPYIQTLQRQCYTIKDLTNNPSMSTDYNEIDTVGMIFLIDPSIKEFDSTKQAFQNVYLADAEKKMICANFWGGLQKFGFQNCLDTGQVVACVNLQKRAGNTRKSIPQFRVTEFSYFTQTPKNVIARKILDDFNKKLVGLDRRKFCQDCVILKNNYLLTKNNENISPYRFMNNDISISKNKVFVESPLIKSIKIDDNFNLTGLDFESTFKQDTQVSEEILKRKRKVNEKIARLKMYGEPPPLSPINIINRSKHASSAYKSPLLNSSENHNNSCAPENSYQKSLHHPHKHINSVHIASKEDTPQKREVEREMSKSPVLLNKTYVKNVNPIKINFDVQENNDSNVDHFAEEFDGSPPMSLD